MRQGAHIDSPRSSRLKTKSRVLTLRQGAKNYPRRGVHITRSTIVNKYRSKPSKHIECVNIIDSQVVRTRCTDVTTTDQDTRVASNSRVELIANMQVRRF